jgi:hypothetical protein
MHTDYASFAPRVALGSGERDSGWYERVYLGLERPRTYLWGFPGEARLGSMEDIAARTRAPRLRFVNKVDAPMDVSDWFAGSRTQGAPAYASGATAPAPSPTSTERSTIVDLQAAGWSFAALDSKGGVWVWGESPL